MSKPILIMAGGTGGHIFPGIAVAQALTAQGVPVVWLGSDQGLENTLVPRAGLRLERIAVRGLRGKGWLSWLVAPLRLLKAAFAAWRVLRVVRPRAALAMGGFACGPGGLVAWLCRVPLIVHEQNRIPGLTNRLLAPLARRVLCGFPDAFPAHVAAEQVGNPVRESIAQIAPPAQRLSNSRHVPMRVLVLGGSQGARAINHALPQAIHALDAKPRIEIWHQAGPKLLEETLEAYRSLAVPARVEPFIEDMAAAYAWAHLVICRSGALTLAELCAAGAPSILIPFPAAVDDHQTRNAQYLSEQHAAILLPESPALPNRIAELLKSLQSDRRRLGQMAEAAHRLAICDAAQHIATICLQEAKT